MMQKLLIPLLLGLLILAPVALAENDNSDNSGNHNSPRITHPLKLDEKELKDKLATHSGQGTDSARFQNRCQAYENMIKQRASNMVNMASHLQGVFNSIAGRVEQFYTNKLVPSGKTVPNYDSLVANIASSSAAVNTTVSKVNLDANSFSCTNPDPKGQLKTFEQDLKNVKSHLKDYRVSIRNLIRAVYRAAAGRDIEASSSAEEK